MSFVHIAVSSIIRSRSFAFNYRSATSKFATSRKRAFVSSQATGRSPSRRREIFLRAMQKVRDVGRQVKSLAVRRYDGSCCISFRADKCRAERRWKRSRVNERRRRGQGADGMRKGRERAERGERMGLVSLRGVSYRPPLGSAYREHESSLPPLSPVTPEAPLRPLRDLSPSSSRCPFHPPLPSKSCRMQTTDTARPLTST